MDFQKGMLQADGETTEDTFKETITTHPSIQSAEKRIKVLEETVARLMNYLVEVDKGMVIKKTNDLGEIEYVRL